MHSKFDDVEWRFSHTPELFLYSRTYQGQIRPASEGILHAKFYSHT